MDDDDKNGKPKFKLPPTYSVSCGKTCMEEDIKVVLEVIEWLLTEGLTNDTMAAPAAADNIIRQKKRIPAASSLPTLVCTSTVPCQKST